MENDKNIALSLENIEAGYLEENLFNQIARLGVLSYLEYLAFRTVKGRVEVLLTKRSPQDRFWSNLYHNPGTVLRPNDQDMSFASALARLNEEFNKEMPMPFFGGLWFESLERGTGLGLITWAEVRDIKIGEYFDVLSLPSNMIKGQARYIKKAAQNYQNFKRGKFNPMLLSELLLQ